MASIARGVWAVVFCLAVLWTAAMTAPAPSRNVQIEVTQDGAVLWNGQKISCEELNARLKNMGSILDKAQALVECPVSWGAYNTKSPQVDATASYVSYNFSSLIVPKTVFLGFIGPEYERLRIHFDKVSQDASKSSLYHVTGSTAVSGNRCDFEGTINVERITRLLFMHFGVDDEYKTKGLKAQGILTARYEFRENPAQRQSGVFKGLMTLAWYVDRTGMVRYDNIRIDSDDYANNQYEGIWTAYGARVKPKKANWGEHRIPDSGELDRGAGEFGPDPKYPGWENYVPGH